MRQNHREIIVVKIKRTILGLICTVVLASCVFQVPETSQQNVIPRTGDVSARVPWLPTLEPQFIDLKEAGFSLVLQHGFEFELDDSSINLSDPSGELVVSLNGRPYIASSYTLESFLDRYIAEMASRGGSFEQGDPYEISIDGLQGIAIDLHRAPG